MSIESVDDKIKRILKANPFPDKKYNIIYADPPWKYSSDPKAKRGIWGLAQRHYETMTLEELSLLPVPSICHDDCMLFLWATFPIIQDSLNLIKLWGFKYKTVAFVWIKEDKSTMKEKKYGLGWYTRSNVEIVLIGRKGKFERQSASVQQIVKSTIGEHSEKPNLIRERILKLCGDIPRIELFPRIRPFGWDVWGNDMRLSNKSLDGFMSD